MASSRRRSRLEIAYDKDEVAPQTPTGTPSLPAPLINNAVLPSHDLPSLGLPDNAAVALQFIRAGQPLIVDGCLVTAKSTRDIPEGHRFATMAIPRCTELRSWGLPFGIARRDIAAGEYLCNEKVLATFQARRSTALLPLEPNFDNLPFRRSVSVPPPPYIFCD